MKKSDFIKKLDHPAIEAAITAAETRTSGEIRVMVTHEAVDDAVQAAQTAFTRLGMTATRERNGVLIFVAPLSQSFAVIGDEGVHQQCGDAFWRALADAMAEQFRAGAFTEGLLRGIDRAGRLLGEQFPRRADDVNELPNRVEGDPS